MSVGVSYSVGEKLLCFHGPLLYEAKCIQVKSDDNELKYFIHYSGWNKNWDEWVTEERILKYSEVNIQKQKRLHEEHVTARKAKSRKKCDKPNEKAENVKKDPIKKKAPVKEEKRPVKEEKRAVKEEKRTVKEEKRAVKEEKRPAKEEKRPAKEEKRPAKEEKRPAKEEKRPAKEEKRPAKEEKRPAKEEKRPAKEEKRPSKKKPSDVEIKVVKAAPEVVKKGAKKKRGNKEVKFVLPKKAKKVVLKKKLPKTSVVKNVAVKNIKKVKKAVTVSTPIKLEVVLPEDLNDWMKDDNYMIKTYKKLLRLPARVTANDIIMEYERLKINVPDLPCASTKIISNGVRNYFNAVLGKRLLYRFERIQYSDVLARFKDIPLCDIYGAIHLLRMLKNVGTYIQENDPTLNNNEILTFQKCFDDFVTVTRDVFNDRLSLEDYETASPEYHRRSY